MSNTFKSKIAVNLSNSTGSFVDSEGNVNSGLGNTIGKAFANYPELETVIQTIMSNPENTRPLFNMNFTEELSKGFKNFPVYKDKSGNIVNQTKLVSLDIAAWAPRAKVAKTPTVDVNAIVDPNGGES